MLKQRDVTINKNISLHFGEEPAWYIIPTIAFHRMNWKGILEKVRFSNLFVIKWLKYSAGIIIHQNNQT